MHCSIHPLTTVNVICSYNMWLCTVQYFKLECGSAAPGLLVTALPSFLVLYSRNPGLITQTRILFQNIQLNPTSPCEVINNYAAIICEMFETDFNKLQFPHLSGFIQFCGHGLLLR